jgi:flagellar biosynthesis/type III secretory pathway protein FliH
MLKEDMEVMGPVRSREVAAGAAGDSEPGAAAGGRRQGHPQDGNRRRDDGVTLEPSTELYAYLEMPWSDDLKGWGQAFGRETLQATPPITSAEKPDRSASDHTALLLAQQRAEIDAHWLARLGDEMHKAEEKGRREGFESGLIHGREESAGSVREEQEKFRFQAIALTTSFAEEHSRYFHLAEEQVVRLAMAITARILRREAQMDPLLLTGAVRVALGQLAQATAVRLYVPEIDCPLWREALSRLPKLAHRPEVIGEPQMELGECRIETELGSADLGLWAQLKEIEHGFFDRVAPRGITTDLESIEAGRIADQSTVRPSKPTAAHVVSPAVSATVAKDSRTPSAVAAEERAAVDESALANALLNEREW